MNPPGIDVHEDGTVTWRGYELPAQGVSENNPYHRVWFRNRTYYVHRLVAVAHVHNPRPDIFSIVDHIDRDKTNNHASNLRWVTHKLNMLNNGQDSVFRHFTTRRMRDGRAIAVPTDNYIGKIIVDGKPMYVTEPMLDREVCVALTRSAKEEIFYERYHALCEGS